MSVMHGTTLLEGSGAPGAMASGHDAPQADDRGRVERGGRPGGGGVTGSVRIAIQEPAHETGRARVGAAAFAEDAVGIVSDAGLAQHGEGADDAKARARKE